MADAGAGARIRDAKGAGPGAEESSRAEVAAILAAVERGTGDTLDPFVLHRAKRYAFSPDRSAVAGYGTAFGIALCSGEPVGPASARHGAMRSFLETCAAQGLHPCVLMVHEDHVPAYESDGWRLVRVGDEAMLDPASLDLASSRLRNARQAAQRARNHGVEIRIATEGELDAGETGALRDVARRALGGRRELGFSTCLDGLFRNQRPDAVVAVASSGGVPVAFQRYLPCRGGAALSLDAMRRLHHAPNGVHEAMIAALAPWAAGNGVEELSLNLIGLRNLVEAASVASGPVYRRLARSALVRTNALGIASLWEFTHKFRPTWTARYVAYRSARNLPRIALAALSLEGYFGRRNGER